jgi:hypothetical protein
MGVWNSMFLVYDNYGNFYEKMNYNELRKLLIEEIVRDGINRLEEDNNIERTKECFEELKELALNSFTKLEYIKKELEQYGWIIFDLFNLQMLLRDFKDYISKKCNIENKDFLSNIDSVLKLVESEMK